MIFFLIWAMHLWKEIIIIFRWDKIMGTTHLELLSKDLNYQFEGKKVLTADFINFNRRSLSPVAL